MVLLITILVSSFGCANSNEVQPNQILFTKNSILWAMDEDGQNRQMLADCTGVRCSDSLSSDGQQSIYVEAERDSQRKFIYHLGVINLDDMQKTEMVSGLMQPVLDSGWSFDDSYIAFTVEGYKESETLKYDWWELYTIDLANGQVSRIAEGKMTFIWSPAENRLAVWNAYGTIGDFGLYLMSPDGSQQQKVFVEESRLPDSYSWSPDGKRLALSTQRDDGNTETSIFLVDVDGRNLEELTTDGQYQYKSVNHPHWSPDGRRVAYIADYQPKGAGEWELEFRTLFVVHLEQGIQKLLVNNVASREMIWSPDSRQILYRSDEDKDWYIVSVKDRTIKKFANSEDVGTVVRWQ